MNKFHIATIFFVSLLVACLAFGQATTTGAIYGKISDETGAVLPGVTITLENPSISARTFTSTALGVYRFVQLLPGDYKLTFELSGFQTMVQENIPVSVGSTTTLNVTLSIATVEEVITVTGETPVVDTKKTGIAADMSQEILANIPSARDPWVILDQVAGVQVDRVNVGGSESGQQSYFSAHGGNPDNVTWNVDGVTITDMAATGATPMYFDFDSFEEIQISTGGNDATIQHGGIALNFITKQGGNSYRGQFSFYGTSEGWQSDNRPTDLKEAGYSGNKINSIRDYGFDVGGPIKKDKLWFWGAYHVQDIKMFTITGTSDDTWLENFNLKFHGQVTDTDKLTFFFTRGDKKKYGRGAGVRRPAPTTHDQKGPVNVYKVEIQHIFNENFLMTASYAFVGGGFQLIPKGGMETQVSYDYDTRMWGRSLWYYYTDRPNTQVKASGSYFLEEAMGGDHEFKFGFEYKHAPTTSISAYGGFAVAVFDAGEPTCAWMNAEANWVYEADYWGFYFTDTFTRGKLTLNLGFRFDQQKSIMPPAVGAANSVVPEMLPAMDFAGLDPGYRWKNFSPRLGFTYDLTGDGKTIIRGNYARYAEQMGNWMGTHATPVGWRMVVYGWNDANGDTFVQRDELIGYPDDIWWWWDMDPDNPAAVTSPNTWDENLSSPNADELIFGVEREVMPQFSVGANIIYRRYTNLIWYPYNNTSSADWSPYTYTDPTYGQTVNYYTMNFRRPAGEYQSNRPDYWEDYKGIELTFIKRLSNKWMLNGSITFQTEKAHYDSPSAYNDPTNIKNLNGQYVWRQMSGSGKTDIWVGAGWLFKLNGMYQLPHGINVSTALTSRQGFIIPKSVYVSSTTRGQGVGSIQVLTDLFGSYRLPNFWMMDFRLEKVIDMGAIGSFGLILDVFNIFNNNMSLGEERQQNSSRAGEIHEIVNPRVIRLGVRLRF